MQQNYLLHWHSPIKLNYNSVKSANIAPNIYLRGTPTVETPVSTVANKQIANTKFVNEKTNIISTQLQQYAAQTQQLQQQQQLQQLQQQLQQQELLQQQQSVQNIQQVINISGITFNVTHIINSSYHIADSSTNSNNIYVTEKYSNILLPTNVSDGTNYVIINASPESVDLYSQNGENIYSIFYQPNGGNSLSLGSFSKVQIHYVIGSTNNKWFATIS